MSPTWTALSLSSLWYVKTFPLSTKKRSCQFFTMDLCFFSQPFFTGVSMDLLKPVWVDPGLPSPGITLLERAEVETDKKQAEYNQTRRWVRDLLKMKWNSIFVSWDHHAHVWWWQWLTLWTRQLPAWQIFTDWLWLSWFWRKSPAVTLGQLKRLSMLLCNGLFARSKGYYRILNLSHMSLRTETSKRNI